MQIVREKPQIDLVFKVSSWALRQEVEQKDRNADPFKTQCCLKEFETANFETQNPKMRFLVPFSPSTLSGNICKVEESGLGFLHAAENNSLDSNLKLTEDSLQVIAGLETKSCSCWLALENRQLRA
jgi:hypothetical protein